jgi:hypothetical protein
MMGVALPAATLLLVAYALRPRHAIAPRRLAAIRAAVAVAAYAVAGVEVLSALRAVTGTGVVVLWTVGLVAAAAAATVRRRRDRRASPRVPSRETVHALRATWRRIPAAERLLAAAIGVLVAAELLLALVSAPNNYDSNVYHLPKIEHWVAQRGVNLYATLMTLQIATGPGAEYLLLHLRLLTGGDGLYNLVQWSAALICTLAASRIAAQLGAGRLGQLIAAATVAGAPMVVLEATSTQNDLVVAAWVVCTASLVVDELGRRSGPVGLLGIGTAAGLAVVTKPTGWLGLAPVLLLWGLSQLRAPDLRGVARAAAGTAVIVALIGALAGPYLLRVDAEFGSPLGPPEPGEALSMQRHDPAALLVNAMRIGASTLMIPVPAVNEAVAGAVISFSRAIGVDPQDRAITVGVDTYPNPRWWPDEDQSPYPVQSALVLVATFGVLVARRVPGPVRAYALTVVAALVAYASVIKWQPWGNRLVGAALILGAPLVGWALPRLVAAARTAGVAAALAVVVAAGLLHGYAAVLVGSPRPMIGPSSMFGRDPWDQRFARRPEWRAGYEWVAAGVRASGARRVGVVLRGDQWEYPWWLLLPGAEVVWMDSIAPHHPPAAKTGVDAVMCAIPADQCRAYVPDGWRFESRDGFSYAVPR